MEAMPLSLGVLADAIENSPFCGKNNAKVHPILTKMLRSTPQLFDAQADPSLSTAELQILDREVFTREYNEHLRCHEEDRRDRKAEKCSSKCSTDVATKTTKEKGFSEINRLIVNHHERTDPPRSIQPTYRFLIKRHFDDGGGGVSRFEICGKDADPNQSDIRESHDVLCEINEPSSADILRRKRKLSSPAAFQRPKRLASKESSGNESQEPVDSGTGRALEESSGYESGPVHSEDLSSRQSEYLKRAVSCQNSCSHTTGTWEHGHSISAATLICTGWGSVDSDDLLPFLSLDLSSQPDFPLLLQEGDAVTKTGETMKSDSGNETENDVQETALKDTSTATALLPSPTHSMDEVADSEQNGLNLKNLSAASGAEKKDNTPTYCCNVPQFSSMQGDYITIFFSAMQEGTRYQVMFPNGTTDATCQISRGEAKIPREEAKIPPGCPCLIIKAPPREQPGTVIGAILDPNGLKINTADLPLTYHPEPVSKPIILIGQPGSGKSSAANSLASGLSTGWTKLTHVNIVASNVFVDMRSEITLTPIREDRQAFLTRKNTNIKKFTSSVVKEIKRSYILDDAIRATCEVLCHASFMRTSYNGERRFGACEVESSECRRSAAILGIEPSPSKVIQNIVKTAIEESRDAFYEITSSYEAFHDKEYQKKLRRKGLCRQLERIKRTGASKGSRRLEHEQRRQRRVERMKRTGKAGKTGEQI